jgi:hypothetical protein
LLGFFCFFFLCFASGAPGGGGGGLLTEAMKSYTISDIRSRF